MTIVAGTDLIMSTQIMQFSFGMSILIVLVVIVVLILVAVAGLAALALVMRCLGATWRLLTAEDHRPKTVTTDNIHTDQSKQAALLKEE